MVRSFFGADGSCGQGLHQCAKATHASKATSVLAVHR